MSSLYRHIINYTPPLHTVCSKCVNCLRYSNSGMILNNLRSFSKLGQKTTSRTFSTKEFLKQQKHCLKNNTHLSDRSSIKLLSPYTKLFHTNCCERCQQKKTTNEMPTDTKEPIEEVKNEFGDKNISGSTPQDTPDVQPTQHVSILKRFKDAYKEYGKVLIGVHIATSVIWYGGFFYAAKSGIDVVPLLEKLGASEKIVKPFAQSGAGNFAVAYLLYKIATPARYTLTIGGTQVTVKQLRKYGYMEKPAPEDSISNLMKAGKTQMMDKLDDIKDEMKDNVKDKMGEMKGNVKGRMDEMKDNVKDKVDKLKEKKPKR